MLSLAYQGFDYVAFYNGAYENSDSLPALVSTGANSVEVTLDYGIDANNSTVVADPSYTDSLTALGNTIAEAEAKGLTVMVRPLIDFLDPSEIGGYSVGEWRQDYQPTNVAAFFASYQQMIVSEAKVAQQNGAQMLSIGAELDQLTGTQYLSYWTSIINAVRAVFTGTLTYSASWNTASQVSFWSELDYEGVDCYVPLSAAPNPTLTDLIDGWLDPATPSSNPNAYAAIGNQSPIQYFEGLAEQSGKPLIFTELGYPNDAGGAANPPALGNTPDPALQAELYQAFFDAWSQVRSTALVGTYFWEWDPDGSTSNVGPDIESFSTQNSPAQGVVTAGFSGLTGTITSGETWFVSAGQTGSAFIVQSGGTLEILPGGNDSGTTLTGGREDVASGGTASATIVSTGDQVVVSGGTVFSATVSDGEQDVSGTANDSLVSGGGSQVVESGGSASGTVLQSGGTQTVSTGGTAIGTMISGGTATVYGTAIDTVVASGGVLIVGAGGVAGGSAGSGDDAQAASATTPEVGPSGAIATANAAFTSSLALLGSYLASTFPATGGNAGVAAAADSSITTAATLTAPH